MSFGREIGKADSTETMDLVLEEQWGETFGQKPMKETCMSSTLLRVYGVDSVDRVLRDSATPASVLGF